MADVGRVMRECRNYFETGYRDAVFTIQNGKLADDLLAEGQYIAICGSFLNDGVHSVGEPLHDETFRGRVWYLHPPSDFLSLCGMVDAFAAQAPASAMQSESFGGYSYTRKSGRSGAVLTWQEAFEKDLLPYRRMYTEVCA